MSILHVAASPADVPIGAPESFITTGTFFDKNRVSGWFRLDDTVAMQFPHAPSATGETWYHWRYHHNDNGPYGNDPVRIYNANGVLMVQFDLGSNGWFFDIFGDATVKSGNWPCGEDTVYTWDIKVEVDASEITVTFYVNGMQMLQRTASNISKGHGQPGSVFLLGGDYNPSWDYSWGMSELIIADEDTRGMRLRELKPTSFGVYQDWDGNIASLRDEDKSTGLSTNVADERASFGVTNLGSIAAEDTINRVIFQSWAQRGTSGLTGMNHFLRFGDGTLHDLGDHTLDVTPAWYRDEMPLNPETGLDWVAEDFAGIQTGIRSRT